MDTPSSASSSATGKMNVIYFGNEFPGDDLKLLLRRLRVHSKDRKHPLLARFLDEATIALKDEVRRSPAEVRAQFPTIESILEIDTPSLRKGPLSGSIDGVLLCVFEIASFIGYLETTNDQGNALLTDASYLSGLGIGLLATVAVALSTTAADIVQAGAQVVRIAFRLGLVVTDASRNIDVLTVPENGQADSWAYVIHGISAEDAQKELDAIHERDCTPNASKIFISAPAATSVTISGPPARLKSLLRTSGFFRDRRSIALPVYSGLCHADHIYSRRHVDKVLDTEWSTALSQQKPRISVLSSCTGSAFSAANAKELFGDVINEIMRHQIRWDTVIQSIINTAGRAARCNVLSFRTSLPLNDLLASLKRELPDVETDSEDMLPWLLNDKKEAAGPRGTMQSKIAIVGMSCRMPGGATNTEKFWEILEQGLDVHRKIPADRFDVESHHDPTGKRQNTSHTSYGCFIDEPGLFDAPFFHMSPKEAAQTDPMQRLALVTAYEALERAGYVANRTAATNLHRIGTWYGQASDDYREVNTAQEISTYFIPGGCRAFGPGRINYFFKFAGPSFNCDTACSSSLASIQAACTALWAGEVDTVVAGGLNVLTNSDAFAGLSHGHFLTKTPNACKTWDSEADGYCRADGVGSVVMKRLDDALEDNDNILGVILAAATNHSANAVSITHPHAGHQEDLGRIVTGRAGIDPLDVSYVEMHGTGTQAGDMEEIQSVANLYAPPAPRRRPANQLLHIGAVKSNVGHGEAAAGVTALLKVLLMLQKGAIPRHVGIKHALNPAFPQDLDKRGLRIPFEAQPWQAGGKKRIAAINNFSAAGGNTTLLIEEGPVRELVGQDPRTSHVVSISAKSKVSLKGNLIRYLEYLDTNPDVSMADLSYSTTARRYQHNHRVVVPAADVKYLQKALKAALEKVDTHKPIPATGAPPVGFVFTGQGASYKSMNLELYHDSPFFRDQILDLDAVAQSQGFPSILPAIDGSHEKDYQHSAVVTQLALVCTEIALARYWMSIGVKPNFVMGHSLGEYAAMHIADVLTAGDVIYLVGSRARMLEEKCTSGSHKMLAVRASLSDIETAANGLPFEVACLNGPQETVLSGTISELDAIIEPLQAAGFRCTSLDVVFAFHSSQTDPILDDFEALAKKGVLFQAPNLPVVSPLLDKVIFDDKTLNATYVRRATREPVNFLAALAKAKKMSVIDDSTAFIEIGPHPVAINFVKSGCQNLNVAVPSMRRDDNNWTTLASSLAALHGAGVEINWNEVHKPFERSLRLLDLPTYAWNDKTYWIQYNGDWALTKGNTFYDAEKGITDGPPAPQALARLSSTVQDIIAESFNGHAGEVTMQADLMQADFLAAAHGHSMNGCGVVTSSIHADIAYTLGEYLYKKTMATNKPAPMGVQNLVVTKGLVAQANLDVPQLIQVTVKTEDITSGRASLEWRNKSNDGRIDEPFATATLEYGQAKDWMDSWSPLSHLIQGRIEALDQLAVEGSANKFSRKMAYTLFANNLVDYADKYRGMQAVTMKDFEAYADVTLTTEKGGKWTVPPYFIDSVAHLAGFIMNCSDSSDVKNTFCVTPGWDTMQFARPLTAGEKYQSYVKMIPTAEDPSVYLGDVYILQAGAIIGKVGGIQFRRYPRVLLSRFFSPPDSAAAKSFAAAHSTASTKPPKTQAAAVPVPAAKVEEKASVPAPAPAPVVEKAAPAPAAAPAAPAAPAASAPAPDSVAAKALLLIAAESGLDPADLSDDAAFNDLGVDSLMSLVVAEKFRTELGVSINGSLFLEYPTIGDMRKWLEEYYS